MADQDRIIFLEQKLRTLKTHIDSLTSYLNSPLLNPVNANFRLTTLSNLFHECLEYQDELTSLSPEHALLLECPTIENNYYDLATKVTELQTPRPHGLASSTLNPQNITISERQQYPKLPAVEIPVFSGEAKEWSSFKNKFIALVHSRDDFSNTVKHSRLEQALSGEAKQKIAEYTDAEEEYPLAWQALLDAYDQKRLLVTKHLDEFFNLPHTDPSNVATSMTMIVDKAKQHLHSLKRLGSVIGDDVAIRWLELRLPKFIQSKWQDTLDINEMPTLKKFYAFCANTVFKLRSLDNEFAPGNSRKRAGGPAPSSSSKSAKGSARALVTAASSTVKRSSSATNANPIVCPYCKKDHRLFKCPDFSNLGAKACYEYAKANKICQNCLCTHATASCSNTKRCKKCDKKHHTLLHFSKEDWQGQGSNSESKSKLPTNSSS